MHVCMCLSLIFIYLSSIYLYLSISIYSFVYLSIFFIGEPAKGNKKHYKESPLAIAGSLKMKE